MIANLTGEDFCPYCLDEGQLPVVTRTETWVRTVRLKGDKRELRTTSAEVDECGPCPRCERGSLLEFPPPDAKGKVRVGPWGSNGFWRGRSYDDLEPQTVSTAWSPPAEARKQLAALMAAVGGPH